MNGFFEAKRRGSTSRWDGRSKLAGFAWIMVACGCGDATLAPLPPPARVSPAPSVDASSAAPARRDVGNSGDSARSSSQTVWDAIYLAGRKVGFRRTIRQRLEDGSRLLESFQQLEVERDGQPTRLEMILSDHLDRHGALVRVRYAMRAGPTPCQLEGVVAGQELQITKETAGSPEHASLPWSVAAGGFFATELALLQDPLEPGEARTVQGLTSSLDSVTLVRQVLRAGAWQPTELPNTTLELLPIDVRSELAGAALEYRIWCDASGEVRKSEVPTLGMVEYRVTREQAETAAERLDLLAHTLVPLEGRWHDLTACRTAIYRISAGSGDPANWFQLGPNQQSLPLDEHAIRLKVSREPQFEPELPAPTAADLATGPLVNTDAREIQELAARADSPHPAELARQLERIVGEHILRKHYGHGFAAARDVARTREGDCTEHAVLLAALCRARSLPCRVVVGLVFVPSRQAFGFHMWNEAWVGNRWISLDATSSRGGIGPSHLKLQHTALGTDGAQGALVTVLQATRGLQIVLEQAD